MSERVRELSREMVGVQIGRQRQSCPVNKPVVRPAEGDDAIGIVAAAEALRDQVRRVDRRAPADQAGQAGDLGALCLARLQAAAAQGGAPLQRVRAQAAARQFAHGALRTRLANLAPVVVLLVGRRAGCLVDGPVPCSEPELAAKPLRLSASRRGHRRFWQVGPQGGAAPAGADHCGFWMALVAARVSRRGGVGSSAPRPGQQVGGSPRLERRGVRLRAVATWARASSCSAGGRETRRCPLEEEPQPIPVPAHTQERGKQ